MDWIRARQARHIKVGLSLLAFGAILGLVKSLFWENPRRESHWASDPLMKAIDQGRSITDFERIIAADPALANYEWPVPGEDFTMPAIARLCFGANPERVAVLIRHGGDVNRAREWLKEHAGKEAMDVLNDAVALASPDHADALPEKSQEP